MEIALANKDIERTVLGVSLNNPQAYYRVADTITGDCFTTPFYGKVWGIMHDIMTGGETPDLMAVANALRMDGGTEGIAELAEIHADAGLSYQGADQYLIDLRDRRNVYLAVTEAQRHLTDPTYPTDEIMQTLSQSVGKVAEAADRGIAPLRDVLASIQAKAFDRMGSGEEAGFNSGFVHIDRLGGLVKSDLTIVAGETSQGKTSLALSMAAHAARPAAYYSLEMRSEQLAARLLAMDTGVPVRDLQGRPLPAPALQRVEQGVERLGGLPLLFDDRCTSNLDTITASIRAMHARHGIEGVVIDYLQILTVNRAEANKEQQMAEAARRLKNLARELGIWVVALSQLNRDTPGTPPVLARLRDSGQIAEAADVVMLIYRPEAYGCRYPYPFADRPTAGTAMIDVAKGRNVGTFRFITAWDAATTRFGDAPPRMGREVRLEM